MRRLSSSLLTTALAATVASLLWTHPQVRPLADQAQAWLVCRIDTWQHSAPRAPGPPAAPTPITHEPREARSAGAAAPPPPAARAAPAAATATRPSADFEGLNDHLDRMIKALEQFNEKLRAHMTQRGDG